MTTTPRATRVRAFLDGIGGMNFDEFFVLCPIDGLCGMAVVSCQSDADTNISKMLTEPFDHRIVWAELSGYVDFTKDETVFYCNACGKVTRGVNGGDCAACGDVRTRERCYLDYIDWLILSGSQTEPTDLDALRRVIADCRAAGVPVLLRNIGARPRDPVKGPEFGLPEGQIAKGYYWDTRIKHPTGSDPSEWPEDLRVRETPKCLMGEE